MAPTKRAAPQHGEYGHQRIEGDAYFTIDAHWLVPALLRAVPLRGPVYDPTAGAGHLMDAAEACGLRAFGSDLHVYEPQRSDIVTGYDVLNLGANAVCHCGSFIMNLPYSDIDPQTARILAVARETRMQVASLVRAEWPHAKARRELVHENPHLAAIVMLTKRPMWSAEKTSSPRHWFSWVVWDFACDTNQPPRVCFQGEEQ